MTSPLPAQAALVESKNSQRGGFLNFFASLKSAEKPSFESLMTKNDEREEHQDELEEAEAAKKRKKSPDAAAVAAQSPVSGMIQPETCLDLTQNPLQPQNTNPSKSEEKEADSDLPGGSENKRIFSKPEQKEGGADVKDSQEAKSATEKSSQTDGVAAPALEKVEVKEPESKNTKHSTSGMKPAEQNKEMISLVTVEEASAADTPQATNEPAITTANRLSPVSAISERMAVTSIAQTGTDSSAGQFSAGNPGFIVANMNAVSQKSVTSQATSLLKSLAPEIEKFQQTGKSQIQLELPVSETESVKIRLNLRGGEIRSTFITESPELRDALQKAWPDFTTAHRGQGIRFGESQFQDSFARNQDSAFQQGRQRQPDAPQHEFFTTQIPKSKPKPLAHTPTGDYPTSKKVNLWA